MLNIKIDFKGLESTLKELKDISERKVPKVAAMALTSAAKKYQQITVDMMSTVFDRPTPWTLRGVYITPATPNNLTAKVWFKDIRAMSGKGIGAPAGEYLKPQIYGGARGGKRYENAMIRYGVLQKGQFTVPGQGVRLNQYGNISSGVITKILTAGRALEGMSNIEFGGKVGRYTLRGGSKNFFIGKPGSRRTNLVDKNLGMVYGYTYSGGKALGVWERYGKHGVRPILIFVNKAPQYKQRLPFFEMAQKVVPQIFRQEFERLARETIAWNNAQSRRA